MAGPVIQILVCSLTGEILRLASPKFGKLVTEEASRKGYLRYIHSRIINNAEEIAFYGGQNIEKSSLSKAYNSLIKQTHVIMSKKLWYVMFEQFLLKYGWAGTGMVTMAIPIFTAKGSGATGDTVSNRTEYYTTAKNLLASGADAGERLMTAYKEVVELAGYTARVAQLVHVFEDCADGKFKKNVVASHHSKAMAGRRHSMARKRLESIRERLHSESLEFDFNGVPLIQGTVAESHDGSIILKNVSYL